MKKNHTFLVAVSTIALSLLTNHVIAQTPGSLDLTFDSDGKVSTPIGSSNANAYSVTLQADNKILVTGTSNNGTNNECTVVRYNVDGSFDPSFDTDGVTTFGYAGANNFGKDLLVQSDGKLIIIGCTDVNPSLDFMIARLNSDGTVDNSFDSDGLVATDFSFSYDNVFAGALQTDGKIIVVGSVNAGSNEDFAVFRYNSNGSLDSTFNGDGKLTTDFGSDDRAVSIALQLDGKLVVAGTTDIGGFNSNFAVARYNSDGSIDNSFDVDGMVTTDFASAFDGAYDLKIQPDGKIIVAGSMSFGTESDFALVRYNINGSLDTSFAGDGKLNTDFIGASDVGTSVVLQADGKIVVTGYSGNGINTDFGLVCYNPNGTLDNTFDSDGKITTNFGGTSDEYSHSILIQPDGKILVAGYANLGSTYFKFALARYYSNFGVGVEPPSIDASSVIVYPNPISDHCMIKYSLLSTECISIELFDNNGKLIKTFIQNQLQECGDHMIDLAFPQNLNSGTYYITISTRQETSTLKLIK